MNLKSGFILSGLILSTAVYSSALSENFLLSPTDPYWVPSLKRSTTEARQYQHAIITNLTGIQAGNRCVEGVGFNGIPVHVCFAPGTPQDYVDYISSQLYGDFNPAYNASGRWTSTSYGSVGSRGNPLRLRWSFVPDGVNIPNGVGEPAAPNNLFAAMNAKFGGNTSLWQSLFTQSFTRWSQVAAITYTQVSDDGASFSSSGGSSANLRGDVRIAGKNIDGVNGILAYNFFPNGGDMVLDTSENWQSFSNNYRFLRNTVMHEHGHGIGLGHTIPTNGSKLMEPYLNTSFDGPMDDDIRGAQRNYGDPYENNDTSATATVINLNRNNSFTRDMVSLDGTNDIDFYRVNYAANQRILARVTPFGSSYIVGNQGGSTSTIDTRLIQNLQLDLRGTNGTTILATAPDNGIGNADELRYVLPEGASFVYARVTPGSGSTDATQRYTLLLMGFPRADVNWDGCVNDLDILQIILDYGTSAARSDIDRNGFVDDEDLLIVLFAFGDGC